MKTAPPFVVLPCGHWVLLGTRRRHLEVAGLMPCSQCVDVCADQQAWMDERADDDQERELGHVRPRQGGSSSTARSYSVE